MFEVVIIDYVKYLVDMNLWIGDDMIYLFFVCYMVLDFGLKYLVIFCYNKYNMLVRRLVVKVNVINKKSEGMIIVFFVFDVDKGCEFDLLIFVKILEEV